MMKLLATALLALTMSGGVALADRGNHRGNSGNHGAYGNHGNRGRSGVTVRGSVNVNVGSRGHYNGNRGGVYHAPRVQRQRVFVSNNRFVFNGGVERRYRQPVFRSRFYNVNVRPQVYVENMASVDGYTWINGDWQWNGAEWFWQPGHYEPVAQYDSGSYDSGYYDSGSYGTGSYDSGYYANPTPPPPGY